MRGEAAVGGRECGRGRRTQSGRSSSQPPETERRSKKSSSEVTRLRNVLLTLSGSEKSTDAGLKDGGAGVVKSQRKDEVNADDVTRELRWRLNRLENEKLELASSHNQQVCTLQAELVRCRAVVERGEAERAELEFKLSVALRDIEREAQTNRHLLKERDVLSERAVDLERSLSDLRSALELTQRGREHDQKSLQQELDERDSIIQRLNQDQSRLHSLLTDQTQVLEQSEQRMNALQREMEKEAELKRRHIDELRYLSDREKRLRGDKEFAEEKIKALEANIEAERAAHLESKFNSEIVQLRLRDLDTALAVERSNLQETTSSAEQLKELLREMEKQREQEQQTGSETLTQLHRLQEEFDQYKSDLSVALETEKRVTSDLRAALEKEKGATASLRERLEEETRQTENATGRVQQLTEERRTTQDAFVKFVDDTKETLQQHLAEDCGSLSPAETLEKLKSLLFAQRQRQDEANKQIEDLLFASEQLLDENQALKKVNSQQKSQIQDSEQSLEQLKQEVTRLQTEGCDWSKRWQALRAEAELERDERKRERDKMEDALSAVREERRRQEQERLSSLRGLLLRLQPHGIMGDLSWDELWFRVSQSAEQTEAELSHARNQVSSLQRVLAALEKRMRRREHDWSRKHRHTVAQLQRHLQSSRAECRSLQDRVTSLTSDLAALCDQCGQFQWAGVLLGGALVHAQVRVQRLSEQKAFLCRRLLHHDALEQEVMSLRAALEAEQDEHERKEKKKSARRRWKRVFSALLALRKWCMLGKSSRVLFRLQLGGVSAVGVSLSEDATARDEGHDESRDSRVSRWLRSKALSAVALSSTSELQGALSGSGSSPQSVMSAAQSALSCLLAHLLDQSDANPAMIPSNCPTRKQEMTPRMKEQVFSLRQHFLDFSQRLHSTEVDRRSLRLELNKLRRVVKKKEQEMDTMVSSERFDSVCSELQGALCREHEAQSLVLELNSQMTELRQKTEAFTKDRVTAQEIQGQTALLLSEARQEVSRKERSLRILGKHLCAVQKERRQLEQRLNATSTNSAPLNQD